jgi:hypothetical protein
VLPENTPPRIQQLLRSCLEKDPRQRLRDIGDARLKLNETLTASSRATPSPLDRHSARGGSSSGACCCLRRQASGQE